MKGSGRRMPWLCFLQCCVPTSPVQTLPHPCSKTGATAGRWTGERALSKTRAASWSPDLRGGISKPHQTAFGWLSSSKSCFQKKAPLPAVLLTGAWWRAPGFVWFLHEAAKRSLQLFCFLVSWAAETSSAPSIIQIVFPVVQFPFTQFSPTEGYQSFSFCPTRWGLLGQIVIWIAMAWHKPNLHCTEHQLLCAGWTKWPKAAYSSGTPRGDRRERAGMHTWDVERTPLLEAACT